MIAEIDEREIDYIMARLGMTRTGDAKRHFRTLLDAHRKYEERDLVRQGLWKEHGAEDSAMHCRSKALRALKHCDKLDQRMGSVDEVTTVFDEAIDDGIDLVNYAAFYVENVRQGRIS